MRKCVIGRVGDGTFQEAWRSLEGGSWRGTLFVHGGLVNGGPMEKTIHFAETFALVLNFQPPSQTLPPTEPIEVILHWGDDGPGSSTTAPGHDSLEGSEDSQAEARSPIDDPAYLEAARRYLRTELSEVLSWEGALFELREGPIPQAILAGEKCLKIRVSPAPLIKGLKPPPASVPCGTPSLLPADPLARIEELQRRLPHAFAWHLITWEQARTWKELGSLHRAIFCWRDLAQHYLDWGAPENACSVLEEALQMCPAHFGIGEELISLHQSSGRVKQAEKVAETLCVQLDKLKFHDLVARIYRALDRAPESAALRRLAAEALVRSGDLVQGVHQLHSIATALDSKGETEGAAEFYERIVEIEPSHQDARTKLQKRRRSRTLQGQFKRWGAMVVAGLLFTAWFLWDMSSASAFQRVKDEASSKDLRQAVGRLTTDAGRFPISGHARRLASLEEELYRRSLEESRRLILDALEAKATGDLGTADHLLGNVVRNTLLPPLSQSAGAKRAEISKEQDRIEDLSRRAQALVQRRNFEEAFYLYSQILSGAKRAVFASSYLVPAMVETVPGGATMELDGSAAGSTPKWTFLPSDPDARLRLKVRGFQPLEFSDPVGTLLQSQSPRLRIALVPEILWETRHGGGVFALQVPADALIIPVLGADGVLRGKKPQGATLWETPLEAGTRLTGPPVVAGPALLLGTKDGVEAFALSTGKPVWSWKAKKADKGLCLGPSFGGQVLVLTGEAVLLNPFTGLVTRRFPRAVETEDQDTGDHPALVAVATSFAIFREGKGDMVGTDLRTGKRAFVREGLLQGAKKIIVKEGILVVLAEGGLLFGLSADGKRKLWETKLGGEYSFLSSAKGELACVGSKGGSLVCISSRTGLPLWKSSLEGELRGLYTEETTGDLIAAELLRENKRITGFLSTGNGRLEWELEASNAESVSVHALDRAVLVSSPSRGIVAFRKP